MSKPMTSNNEIDYDEADMHTTSALPPLVVISNAIAANYGMVTVTTAIVVVITLLSYWLYCHRRSAAAGVDSAFDIYGNLMLRKDSRRSEKPSPPNRAGGAVVPAPSTDMGKPHQSGGDLSSAHTPQSTHH